MGRAARRRNRGALESFWIRVAEVPGLRLAGNRRDRRVVRVRLAGRRYGSGSRSSARAGPRVSFPPRPRPAWGGADSCSVRPRRLPADGDCVGGRLLPRGVRAWQRFGTGGVPGLPGRRPNSSGSAMRPTSANDSSRNSTPGPRRFCGACSSVLPIRTTASAPKSSSNYCVRPVSQKYSRCAVHAAADRVTARTQYAPIPPGNPCLWTITAPGAAFVALVEHRQVWIHAADFAALRRPTHSSGPRRGAQGRCRWWR
jgi:hypothetical protein